MPRINLDECVRPQELLLSRPAGRLSNLAVPAADRRPRPAQARHARWCGARDRHHAAASRTGRRQEPARPAPAPDLCRSEPGRGRVDGDRLRARPAAHPRKPGSICANCARSCAIWGTCDGNMEEGSLRCDCNVSVRRPGEACGTRCEIKNLNSVRHVMQAIEYEARRQIDIIEEGGAIAQQTRLFDTARGITRVMRSKEEAHDYRYFPDPDLLPLVLDPQWVAGLKAHTPRTARRQEGAVHRGIRAVRRERPRRPRRRAGGNRPSISSASPPAATPGRRPIG